MRRLFRAVALAAPFAGAGVLIAFGPAHQRAWAQEEARAAAEPAEAAECPTAMTEAADDQCREYWERHINWFSWDYKAGPDQAPEHRHMPPPFGFALINFAVFAAIMYRLAAKPLADFVRTRHTTIRRDIDEAAALHREAEGKLREFQGRIGNLDREIELLLADVRKDAEAEKARIIAAAEEQAVRLKADAERQIENELQRIQRELKVEAVGAAVAAAQAILADKIEPEDQAKLAERFATELESARAAAPRLQ